MAPPITVDIMVILLAVPRDRMRTWLVPWRALRSLKNIPQTPAQQDDTSQPKRKQVRFHDIKRPFLRPLRPSRLSATPMRRPNGRGADNDRVRQLRPHPCDQGRPRQGGGLRGYL